eukprot:533473_1
MMSHVKSESSGLISAILDQNGQSPIIKSELDAPPQPPTAEFRCDYCGKEFNLEQYLIRHVIETHGNTCMSVKPEPYSIQSVPSEAATHSLHEKRSDSSINADIAESNSSMSLPQSLESSSVELQNASISREYFTRKKVQNEHMIVDSGENHFTCELCQKNYSQKGGSNAHLHVHSCVNLYSCEVCRKNFSQKGHLKRH